MFQSFGPHLAIPIQMPPCTQAANDPRWAV